MADSLYEVEQIVGKKMLSNRRVLYQVRWRGFSSDHDSWEPACNLVSCKKLMYLYNNSDSDNPVIREDASPSASKASNTISPGKQTPKGDKKTSKLAEKDKNLKKEDSRLPKSMASSDLSTPDKEVKNSKESHAKVTSSTQVDFPDVPDNISIVSNSKVVAKKPKSAVKPTKNSSNKTVDSISPNFTKKTRQSTDKGVVYSNSGDKTKTRKRKLPEAENEPLHPTENDSCQHGPSSSKKQKLLPSQNAAQQSTSQDKTTPATEEVVDLTKSDSNTSSENGVPEEIEISDEEEEEDDDDDENVLYSLNSDCDLLSGEPTDTNKKNKESLKAKLDSGDSTVSVISKLDCKTGDKNGTSKNGGGKKKSKRISLMDSKKSPKAWSDKSDSVHTGNSSPPYTSVKDMMGDASNPDPSKPSGNSLPDPVSPEASETYLADVPSSFPVPAEEPVMDEPLSPSSLLYKSLLDSLPHQIRPAHKGNGKKVKGDSARSTSNGMPGKSLFGPSSGKGPVERRTSVRSSECAFRYKQIVVKKCSRYTQIWLNTTTVMKNALNPLVIQEIVSALNSAKYDDSHLVLFSALGSVFCSGTDLHYLVSGDRAMAARQMAEKIRELTKTFITFPKPIIAAVSGAAVGMGVSLLAVCDVVYASDKASFHMPYSQLSQTPEGCSSFTLPLTVGIPSANELLYGARKITAMEAYQLGLVSQVFWPTLMMQEIIPRVQNMSACSSKALEATKLLVRSHHRTKMELTNETECNLLLESWFSVECQQAIEAYISNEKNFSF